MFEQVIAWSRGQPGHSFASAKQELQMYGLKSCTSLGFCLIGLEEV